jgi:hypothetical protein
MRRVATPVPITAGMPYSRATIEPWLSGPSMSVTTAEAIAKGIAQNCRLTTRPETSA